MRIDFTSPCIYNLPVGRQARILASKFSWIGLAVMASWISSGCAVRGALRPDVDQPFPSSARVPGRVVLVREPGPPARLHHKELPSASVDMDLSRYPSAAAAMLGSVYEQVSVATSAVQAQDADFVVSMSSDYPRTVGLTFTDSSGAVIAGFSRPGWPVPASPEASSVLVKILTPPALIVSFGTLEFAFMERAYEARNRIRDSLSTATRKALDEIRGEIASAPSLRHPVFKSRAAASPVPPLPAGTASVGVCKNASSSKVQPEALELFKRGKDYLGLARSVQEYAMAAMELEKAVAAAPCWPDVQLSCAMAHEGAHEWEAAASRLRAYLDLNGDVPDAARLRAKISELESRPRQVPER